jgi:tRNA(Ile)-lysidine synthase TilS/MesJ
VLHPSKQNNVWEGVGLHLLQVKRHLRWWSGVLQEISSSVMLQIRNLQGKSGKVAVGLSGGVNSAIAVHLLKRSGFQVIGVH